MCIPAIALAAPAKQIYEVDLENFVSPEVGKSFDTMTTKNKVTAKVTINDKDYEFTLSDVKIYDAKDIASDAASAAEPLEIDQVAGKDIYNIYLEFVNTTDDLSAYENDTKTVRSDGKVYGLGDGYGGNRVEIHYAAPYLDSINEQGFLLGKTSKFTLHLKYNLTHFGDDPKTFSGVNYRLYNKWSGEHLFTEKEDEQKDLVAKGWTDEGKAWGSNMPSGSQVYRLYNQWSHDHHYTTSLAEYDICVSNGWTGEGVHLKAGGDKPVYRLYNPYEQAYYHHFTMDPEERDVCIKNGWVDEGIAWYAFDVSDPKDAEADKKPSEGAQEGSDNADKPSNNTSTANYAPEGQAYITTGDATAYHRYSNCRSLANAKGTTLISIADAEKRGLHPCPNCH